MSIVFKEIDVRLAVFDRLTALVIRNEMALGDIPEVGQKLADWIMTGSPAEVAEVAVQAPAAPVAPFSGKPTVPYLRSKGGSIGVGYCASVYVNRHPVLGYVNDWVSTSTVLSIDVATGAFETRNTKYVPV